MNKEQTRMRELHKQLCRELAAQADFVFGNPEHFHVMEAVAGELLPEAVPAGQLTFIAFKHPEDGSIISRIAKIRILEPLDTKTTAEHDVNFQLSPIALHVIDIHLPSHIWSQVVHSVTTFLQIVQE